MASTLTCSGRAAAPVTSVSDSRPQFLALSSMMLINMFLTLLLTRWLTVTNKPVFLRARVSINLYTRNNNLGTVDLLVTLGIENDQFHLVNNVFQ